MIVIPDSNKDGGILASFVELRQCPNAVLTQNGGCVMAFGCGFSTVRGARISRGAGPTHRFIKSLPDPHDFAGITPTHRARRNDRSKVRCMNRPAIYNLELFLAGNDNAKR